MEQTKIDHKAEEAMIDAAFQDMLNCYLASNHRKKVEKITRAYNFAKEAHKGARRRSGEPYILHPIAVAKIANHEIGLGSTSICAALLHDVIEDTDYTAEDIEQHFGKKIAQIVVGLTKISGGIFGDKASAQAENFEALKNKIFSQGAVEPASKVAKTPKAVNIIKNKVLLSKIEFVGGNKKNEQCNNQKKSLS